MPTLRPRKGAEKAPTTSVSSDSEATGTPISIVNAPSNSKISSNLPKKRPPPSSKIKKQPPAVAGMDSTHSDDETRPLSDDASERGVETPSPAALESRSWAQRNQWIVLALASGACAAFNGVFAKLTTTELTTKFSLGIAHMLGLDSVEGFVEILVRGSFFGLNLVFNGVMWTLFTKALARGNSTTQVSIMNTSANFVITAILGFAIFSEALPPLWWVGASFLVAGNVIIGKKDEGTPKTQEQQDSGVIALGDEDDSELDELRQEREGTVRGAAEVQYKDEDVADLRI